MMDNLVDEYQVARQHVLDRFQLILEWIKDVYPCEFHDTHFTDNEIDIYAGEGYVVFNASSPVPYEDWDYTASLDVPVRFFSTGVAFSEVVEYYRNLALEQERKWRKEELINFLQEVRRFGDTVPHELLAKAVGATTYKEIEEVVEQYLEDGHE